MSGFIAAFYGLTGLLDAACAEYRRVAGRTAVIRKGPYLQRAMLRGLAAGVAGDLAVAAWLSALSPEALHRVALAGIATLPVSVPMVVVFGLATVQRWFPEAETRSMASAVLFGPLTFIRPYAIVLCAGVAVVSQPALEVMATVVVFLGVILWWTRCPWPFMSTAAIRRHRMWGEIGA